MQCEFISDPSPLLLFFFTFSIFFFNNVVLDLFYICNGNGIPSILKSYAVLPSGCWEPEWNQVGSQDGLAITASLAFLRKDCARLRVFAASSLAPTQLC